MKKLTIYLLAICLLGACGEVQPPAPTGEQMVARACDDLAGTVCFPVATGAFAKGAEFYRCKVKEIRACLEEDE